MTQNVRGLPDTVTEGSVLNDQYSFDANANVAGIADLLAANTSSRTMGYDHLDRLTTVSTPNMWGSATYGYDALDNLVSSTLTAGGTARTLTHTINATTNRIDSTSGGPAAFNFGYTYDGQGNITQRGAQAYVFDRGNRMKSATGKATYLYDGWGHRVSVVGTDAVNWVQVYGQNGPLLYAGPTGTIGTKYVYLHNHVLAEVASTGTTYNHTDALGSPVAQTNVSGALLNRTRYESYGFVAIGTPKMIGFTGYANDTDTGLIYMQQRYYDPVAGRFLSIDPVTTDEGNGDGFNRYSYANNNPFTFIDPDGRDPEPAVVIIPGKREPVGPPNPIVRSPEHRVFLVAEVVSDPRYLS